MTDERKVPGLVALVRYVVRAFYQPIHSVIVELILRDRCISFNDIKTLIHLGTPQVCEGSIVSCAMS